VRGHYRPPVGAEIVVAALEVEAPRLEEELIAEVGRGPLVGAQVGGVGADSFV